jgi:hypothetical protein
LGALFLPQLLSTSWGKPLFIRALEKRLGAQISIDKLHLSWLGPQAFSGIQFSEPRVQGKIDALTSSVPLWSLSELGSTFTLENGLFSFPGTKAPQLTSVNAHLASNELQASGNTTLGGHFSIQGKIYSKEDYDISGDLKQIPVAALDSLLAANGALTLFLGDTLDLSGSALFNNTQGALKLALSSPNVQGTINGHLTDKAFLLSEPLTLQIHHPYVQSDQPALLRISDKGFSFPLPFDLSKLTAQGSFDLGKVRMQVAKNLASLLALLKGPSSNTIEVWFTSADFSVSNAHLNLGRIDALLARSVHLCGWGQIDLIHQTVDGTLGLPADTLARLGIPNLPSKYVMKIPVSGPISDPNFASKPAIAKIAALIASQQIPKPKGIFGKLLPSAPPVPLDKDVPEAKRPFPWE